MIMDIREIQNLIKFVAKSGATEVKLEMDDFKITIKTTNEAAEAATAYIQHMPVNTALPQAAAPQPVAPTAPVAATPARPPPLRRSPLTVHNPNFWSAGKRVSHRSTAKSG